MPTTQEHTRREHIDFMAANGRGWPAWPFLPLLRHRTGEPELAVLIAGKRWQCVLFEVNLIEAMMAYGHLGERLASKAFIQWLDRQPQRTYTSFETMYRAGWRVD